MCSSFEKKIDYDSSVLQRHALPPLLLTQSCPSLSRYPYYYNCEDSSIPNGHLPVSPHGAQFDVNLFTPSFLCINEKWTFSTGSFAIFCPDEKLPSGRAVMKFVIAMNLTDKSPRLLVTVIKLLIHSNSVRDRYQG